MDLGVVAVVKKIFRRVMVYVFVFIIMGIIINRLFLLFFGRSILLYNRPGDIDILISILIIITLFLVFPFLYIFLLKRSYFETIVSIVWNEYHNDLIRTMVKHLSTMIVANHTNSTSENVRLKTQESLKQRFDDTPFWSKLLVNYIRKRTPILDKIQEVTAGLDDELLTNKPLLEKAIHEKLKPYLYRTDVETWGSMYRLLRVLSINIVLLICIYLFISYI